MKSKKVKILSLIFLVCVFIPLPILSFALDAEKDGPIYGDPEGLARVAKLEEQLHNMHIREDHPRIILNKDNIEKYRAKIQNNPFWNAIKEAADNGNMIAAAFVYQMTKNENYANIAIQKAIIMFLIRNVLLMRN